MNLKDLTKTEFPPAKTWQAQKSSLKRERITIATLECIAEHGYSRTTMARIAEVAGVSQGAMQYHFESKMEAIKASIDYLHEKRLRDQQRDVENVPPGVDPIDHIVDVYWRHLHEEHFVAYQELVMAARTEPELSLILRKAYRAFHRAWREHALNGLPAWRNSTAEFHLICDIVQYQMEGLAFGLLNGHIDEAQAERVIEFCRGLLRNLLRSPEETESLTIQLTRLAR